MQAAWSALNPGVKLKVKLKVPSLCFVIKEKSPPRIHTEVTGKNRAN